MSQHKHSDILTDYPIHSLFNRLYKTHFPIYKILYFAYKRISDRDKIRVIKGHVKPGMAVLDIGANIGFYTIMLSRLVGTEGLVYAFEPDEDNYHLLRKLTQGLTNVKLMNVACGEKSGKTYLYKSSQLNIDHQVYKTDEARERIEITSIAIDDLLKDSERSIGFIKIDVQGYDHHVFKGMAKTVARSQKVMIISELWPYGLKKAGTSANQYLSDVAEAGFDINIAGHGKSYSDFSINEHDKLFYVDFIANKKK